MAGMLTVVNPRHRRRRRRKTTRRRRSHARAASNPTRRRRRRVRVLHAAPRRRRRRAHRNPSRRHRRHRNPFGGGMGNVVGTLTKGVGMAAGVIAANLATNGVNHMLGANAVTGPGKIALKAGVGIIALPMLLKFVPGGRKFAGSVAIGAAIAVGLDIYEQYVKANLPAYLQDYQYGSLNAYRQGSLEGWAPQGMADSGIYDGGVY